MSSQNPYEQLGVSEASSFEEIQDARNRLFSQHEGDRKQLEVIEAAYDAVIMDRLRLRQEGKIKVPDRIRFPEKAVQVPASPPPLPVANGPEWLQSWIDTPSRNDILLPAGVLVVLSALILFYASAPPATLQPILQTALILAAGATFYFLFRKEKKFGKSVLLSFAGLAVGLGIGSLVTSLLQVQLNNVGLSLDVIPSLVTFIVLWLISSFLR